MIVSADNPAGAIAELPVVNMLWVDGRLGPVERACMLSVLRQEHKLVLWHYFPLEGVPDGVELRDGNEIVPRERLFRHVPTGSWSLFSNLFRYRLLQRGLGLWFDCDAYLLRPIRWSGDVLLGFDSNGLVAAGVIGLPPDSPILAELIGYFESRRIPDWLPLRWRLRFAWQRLLHGRYRIETMPWGGLGPNAVTAMVQKYGLNSKVFAPEVFYPWAWQDAAVVLEREEQALARVTPETLALHLYNEMIRGWKDSPAPPGSLLARLQREGA